MEQGDGGGEERERFITVAIGRGYSFSRKLIKEVKKEQKKREILFYFVSESQAKS